MFFMGQAPGPKPTPLSRGLNIAIRVEMARLGINQSRLAELSGVNVSMLSKRLNGTGVFTVVDLENLANALGVAPHILIERAEQEAQHLKPTALDVLDLAADHTTQPLDRDRWEAENEHDDPA